MDDGSTCRDPYPSALDSCSCYLDVDMAHDYEMVHLAEREDPRDINMASSSTNTLLEHSRKGRISERLFVVHVLHSVLLVICLIILVAGINRWEHRVSVNVQKASQVASYISVGFQAFFTASILVLFWLSRSIAIDDAIRHPQTLLDLDMRLQAWTGLGPSLTNWLYEPGRVLSRLSPILSTIPIYFVAGTVLQITSSGVLGVNVYNYTSTTTDDYAATNHMGSYSGIDDIFGNRGLSWWFAAEENTGLWQAARQNMFLPDINNTQTPGLQGRLLHDIPNVLHNTFDLAHVNGTRINVQCSQPQDVLMEALLLPQGINDTSVALHSNDSKYVSNATNTDYDDQVWLNVSMSVPPYWDSSVPGLNFSSLWSQSPYAFETDQTSMELPTKVILQVWAFSNNTNVSIGHHQVIFALATGDPSVLIRDSNNSTGIYSNFTIIPGRNVSDCLHECNIWSGSDCDNRCKPQPVPGYLQVIGCSMHTTQVNVSVTETGLLPKEFTQGEHAPHEWVSFEWEQQSEVIMDRQFLIIFSPAPSFDDPTGQTAIDRGYTGAERLLKRALVGSDGWHPTGMNLSRLESDMELLSASYFWNYWQTCDFPKVLAPDYVECDSFRFMTASNWDRVVAADFTGTETRARLEVVIWRAAVSVGCSLVMAVLAMGLLGMKTDLGPGESLKGTRFVETVALMRGSGLPGLVVDMGPGVDRVPLRYGVCKDGSGANLDVAVDQS
ncbi:hypothetical protein ARMSODRAFT_354381 [Armillaria solidipes]|uniref:Uncharacterized protein n=1 Tax=Armillaria solidipes TaxID=1076256 RepID=A0A2H3B989_9AGAR|nr:hypothetical protein ARMSODRAFT_354381 [Armillaria solidipes]